MTSKKINQLPSLTGAEIAETDDFVVYDASAATTKRISKAELALSVGVLDEDDFASDSATQAPSQQSVKAYVAANVGAATAALAVGAVGSYAMCVIRTAGLRPAFGATIAGSGLSAHGALIGSVSVIGSVNGQVLNSIAASASTLSGTWRCMSDFSAATNTDRFHVGLFLRIS